MRISLKDKQFLNRFPPVVLWVFVVFGSAIALTLIAYIGYLTFGADSTAVTINQKAGTADPNPSYTSVFEVNFSEPIDKASFTAADITLGGTAPGQQVQSITEAGSFNGTTFDVRIQADSAGTIEPTIAAGTVTNADNADTNLASTSTDNSVTYDGEWAPGEFVTTWRTDNPGSSGGNEILIPVFSGATYNYDVDWGDGNTDSNVAGNASHIYGSPGTYKVKITGTFPQILLGASSNPNISTKKFLEVNQWGTNSWTSMESSFSGVPTLTIPANDRPDLSNATSMKRMLEGANSFNNNLNHWDVSNITDMSSLFLHNWTFNQPLNNWDVGSVTNMANMFQQASAFNQPLNNWDVSNVANMSYMFSVAPAFNQPLNNWNTSSATDMSVMFFSAQSFNQSLNNWNTNNVNNMRWMFHNATAFNQPLNNWDVSSVTNMSQMFQNASAFNQSLMSWDVSGVTDINQMFTGAALSTYNYDNMLIGWSRLTLQPYLTLVMDSAFCHGEDARADIISSFYWTIIDTGKNCDDAPTQKPFIITVKTNNSGTSENNEFTIPVSDPSYDYSVDCNNDGVPETTNETLIYVCEYTVPGVYEVAINGIYKHMQNTLSGGMDGPKILDVLQWGDIEWQSMSGMFYGANNLQISAMDAPVMTNVTSMFQMFEGASNFNSNINHWDVSSVTDMVSLFRNASSFNQPLNNWNVSNVTTMQSMFEGAAAFNRSLAAWNVSNVNNMTNIFSAPLSTVNYDATLSAWSGLSLQSSVGFDAGGSTYCASESARSTIISTFNWSINDDGKDCTTSQSPFVLKVRTTNFGSSDNNQFMISTGAGSFDFNVDCDNDGIYEATQVTWSYACTYDNPGDYEVAITGTFPHMSHSVGDGYDREKILEVIQWGDIEWQNMSGMFAGASNVQVSATDVPDLSNVTDLSNMFMSATSFNSDISNWDVSNITIMQGMLANTALSTANYDLLLAAWAQQPLQNNVTLEAYPSRYCESELDRQYIISNFNWTIYDNGLDYACLSPQNLMATPAIAATDLDWDDVSGAYYYEVQYKKSDLMDWLDYSNNGSTIYSSNVTVSGLEAEVAYDFRVRAADGFGGFSDWSDVVSATTLARQTYHITNCVELQSIVINPVTFELGDSTGNYYIDNDIDCSDTANWTWEGMAPPEIIAAGPMGFLGIMNFDSGSAFTGNIYGQGHTINGLYQNYLNPNKGLIRLASGSTIDNLHIGNITIKTNNGEFEPGLGGLLSKGENVTLTKVSVTGGIEQVTEDSQTAELRMMGGLAGQLQNSIISESYSNISVSARPGNQMTAVGGLVGAMLGQVEDSYALGGVLLEGDNTETGISYVGGLVGYFYGGTERSYASGSVSKVNNDSSIAAVGGLNGLHIGTLEDSFSIGSVSNSPSSSSTSLGGLAGMLMLDDDIETIINNNYFDVAGTGQSSCIGSFVNPSYDPATAPENIDCTAVNTNGNDPGYFNNSSTNPPLDSWDFNSIWRTNASTTPTFLGDEPPVQTAPGIPRSLAVDVASVRKLKINWQAPLSSGGSSITDYVVQYKKSSSSTWQTFNDGTSATTTTTITGISQNTSYDVRIAAVNVIGQGDFTDVLTVSTLPLLPPQNVVATAHPVSIELDWDNMDGADRYEVSYKKTSEATWQNYDNDGIEIKASYIEVYGLDSNTSYDLRLRSIDDENNITDWTNTITISTIDRQVYHITNCRQLQAIGIDPVTYEPGDLTGHYILDNDIDCSETANWTWEDLEGDAEILELFKGFMSIGAGTDPIFIGSIDGRNHTISGLYSQSFGGIFIATEGATIRNLTVSNSSFKGISGYYTGGLAVIAKDTTISNVHYADLTLEAYSLSAVTGGLIGLSQGNNVIVRSSSTGSIEFYGVPDTSSNLTVAGGLVGGHTVLGYKDLSYFDDADPTDPLKIEQSYADMAITINGHEDIYGVVVAGGLHGGLPAYSGVVEINNSYAWGSINVDLTNTNGVAYIGGIAAASAKVSNTYSNVNIIANIVDPEVSIPDSYVEAGPSFNLVGGITAFHIVAEQNTITNSFYDGVINANEHVEVGGLVGVNILFYPEQEDSFPSTYTTNSYFNTAKANSDICGQKLIVDSNDEFIWWPGDTSCTSVNQSNSQPNYFINNATNPPMDTWDFDYIWQTNATTPPTFIRPTTTEPPVETVPSAPRNLAVTNRTTTAISIAWQPPLSDGGSPVTHYQVQYKKSSSSTWVSAPLQSASQTSHNFINLDPDTSYDFRVAAINSVGTGPYTAPVAGRTLAPDNPPPDDPPEECISNCDPVAPPPDNPPEPPTTDTETNTRVPGPSVSPLPLDTTVRGATIGPFTRFIRSIPEPIARSLPYSLLLLLVALSALYTYSAYLENHRRKTLQALIDRFKASQTARSGYLEITSHYINTPIAQMQGTIELLAGTKQLPQKTVTAIQAQLKSLKDNAANLLNLSQDLAPHQQALVKDVSAIRPASVLTHPKVWLPTAIVFTLTALVNFILIQADKYDPGFIDWAAQVGIALVGVAALGVSFYFMRSIKAHRQTLARQVEYETSVANQQSNFIEQAYILLNEDLKGLEDHRKTVAAKPKSDGYATGLTNLNRIITKLYYLAQLTKQVPGLAWNVPVATALTTATGDLQPLADEKGVSVATNAQAGLTANVDEVSLSHLVSAPLKNAIMASPAGSQVKLTVRPHKRNVAITVQDRGPGIPKAKLDKLLQPFSRVSTEQFDREGLGLDLYFARVITEQYGGNITLESADTGGTIARVEVPGGRASLSNKR